MVDMAVWRGPPTYDSWRVQELDSEFANVVTGLLGLDRNPTAHDPKIHRVVSDEELLEALTAMSMVHRRLDGASLNRSP